MSILRAPLPIVALAACSFALPEIVSDAGSIFIQLTPSGPFQPSDGRAMPVAAWRIDHAIASRVIARFQARRNSAVVDYEHQTLHKESNGQPAPAAAWMRDLEWREGQGLFARVELTSRAIDLIRGGEYRFVSPVFQFDPTTGDVLSIEMAALTNHPAIDGMEPLALRAAATFALPLTYDEEHPMDPLLKALLAALGLPDTTTQDQAIAACAALKPKLDALGSIANLAGVEGVTDGAAVLAACSAKLQTAATPDPTKFVPIAALEDVRGQLAALSAEHTDRKVGELVSAGLEDGRLLPSMKDWANDLGKTNLAALSAYLDKAQPITSLGGTQTGGREPSGGTDENGLTGAELAVCSATGVDPKDYAAAKAP